MTKTGLIHTTRRLAIASLLLCLMLAPAVKMLAQNLIPNHGFEEVMTTKDYQWVQPEGPFYHYEKSGVQNEHTAHTGSYLNGICMYNHEPNEYLHIKLKEPLQAGQKYVFTTFARLWRAKSAGHELQQYIGVHFGTQRMDNHLPGDIDLTPQLQLTLPKRDRLTWFLLRDTLVAKGGEQYMTLGYFTDNQRQEYNEIVKEAFMDDVERSYEASLKRQEPKDDKSWLYMPPDEQKKYLKEKAKKDKQLKKAAKKAPMEQAQPQPATSAAPRPSHRASKVQGDSFFSVRYYFDDFCLAPIVNGESRCEVAIATPSAMENLKTGAVVSLPNVFFELDKDLLRSESLVQLEALQEMLLQYPGVAIEIRGHTDNQGAADYNLDLSERRAAAVVDWLVANGVQRSRLTSKGFGAKNPVETNDTEAGRARNRRVEFYVVTGL